ncbi:MAG: ABC transporter permease [Chloroflexi bacterium]|nr:ABC transporter permease [Chloroflexota bacterium]
MLDTDDFIRKPRSLWSNAWRQFKHHRMAMACLFVLIGLVLVTVFGPLVYTRRIDGIDFVNASKAPELDHPFGTDDIGRDMLARVLWGGRISLSVGVASVLGSITLGMMVGALSGYFGGKLDTGLMRLTDLFLSLPQLPFLLMVIYLFRDTLRTAFGPETGIFLMIVGVIAVTTWMPVARLVRASFLSLKQKEFVEAAHSVGVRTPNIIMRHILPNVLSPVIVAATIGVGGAIITESALSFLGLGFPPDVPSWGRLLNDGRDFLEVAPHVLFFPGLFVSLTVISINYIGDGMRDALDPRKTR